MASEPKLKIAIGADTKDFTKGAKGAKQELNDLKSVGSNALGKVGDAVGVDTEKLKKFASGLRGLGKQMQESGTAGGNFFGKILSGITGTTTALAGLGIGAVVASFKLLNGEAENFRSLVQGAGEELASKTYIDTYKQAFHDMTSAVGEEMAQTQDKMKEGWARVWTKFKDVAISALTTDTTEASSFGEAIVKGIVTTQAKSVIASDKADKARQYQTDLYNALRKQSDELVIIAQLNARIQELREKSMNSEYSTKDQLEAILKVRELISQKYAMLVGTQDTVAQNMKNITDLAGSTPEQIDATNRALAQTETIRAQEKSELREIDSQQTTLTNEIKKQNIVIKKQKKLYKQIAEIRNENLSISKDNPLNNLNEQAKGLNPIKIKVKPVIDKTEVLDISKQLTSIISDSVSSLGENIGTLIGDLVTGGDAWSNFANLALTAFGNIAISIGKTAVATGIATLGIKAALESLNGYVAIAAGLALIALGSAVKTGLSNISSGGSTGSYSSSSYVASSDYGSSSSDLAERDISINISGKMTAQGNALVAVLNNENVRKQKTT
jgi:hypothetical protein